MIKEKIRSFFYKIFSLLVPDAYYIEKIKKYYSGTLTGTAIEDPVKLNPPFSIANSKIGKYTYISENSKILCTTIGRFCSIGPNLFSGWGIHPTNGISTAPMFYSTKKQNGYSLSAVDKIQEQKEIVIGNDVFIGANVIILDGVTISNGAIVGAGCVVSKNVPPYAIVAGVPMRILKYRFEDETIEKLLKINWWNSDHEELKKVEQYFYNVEEFIKIYEDR